MLACIIRGLYIPALFSEEAHSGWTMWNRNPYQPSLSKSSTRKSQRRMSPKRSSRCSSCCFDLSNLPFEKWYTCMHGNLCNIYWSIYLCGYKPYEKMKTCPSHQDTQSLVKKVNAKDFPFASFREAMSRIQQVALSKANCNVPCPADQLAMLRAQKEEKAKKQSLSSIIFYILLKCY